jgi:hypothetical protein
MCVAHSEVFKVEEAVGVMLPNQLDEPRGSVSAWIEVVPREDILVNEFVVFFSTNTLGRPSLDGG